MCPVWYFCFANPDYNGRHRPEASRGGEEGKERPMLKLNTGQKGFEDKNIKILQDASSSYVIQNHAVITNLTELASASKHKMGSFFNQKNSSEPYGDYYYVLQKSNGEKM